MSDHVLDLLGAYLDGELRGGQLRKVEAHLDECQTCLEELQALQTLSLTLQDVPVPAFPSAERLAADVALRLPRKPVTPASRRALEIGWWLAPVGLIVLWIFLSTSLLVSRAVTTAGQFGLLDNVPARLVTAEPDAAYWSGALAQFGVLTGESLQWAEVTESFARISVSQIVWQVAIAVLYLCWIAIWWARHTRQGLGQPFDSGGRPTVN